MRLALALGFVAALGRAQVPAEPLLRDLPPGVVVDRSILATADQVQAIGRNLGGAALARVTNSDIRVHGSPIRVNVLTAVDATNADVVHAWLAKMKARPFCERKGLTVIEYVVKGADAALATKTSYELGVIEKPKSVRYRVSATLATIDAADYMACNPLFNYFLALDGDGRDEAAARIAQIVPKFTFGRRLTLRGPRLSTPHATYTFVPAAATTHETGATITYAFDALPNRHGVPFVTATIEVTANERGFTPDPAQPPPALLAPTAFWPSADPAILALALRITEGKTTPDAKVAALLAWLTPGRVIQYAGQTGSRYGTAKVLDQKFGHCFDFADCFVTLARAAGVPARAVAGWLYGASGHVWAEFHRPGAGWQQVDPTGGGQLACGVYHVPYLTSEDGAMPIVYVAMPQIDALPPN